MKYTKPELQFVGSGSELVLGGVLIPVYDSQTASFNSTEAPNFSMSAE
jgi:hypothetical protein